MTPFQKFTHLVNDVNSKSKVLDAAILVNADGLILASAVQKQLSDERIGALGAQFGAYCEQFSRQVGHGQFEINLLSSKNGFVVVSNVSNKIFFIAKASEKSDVAIVMSSSMKVVKELKKMEKEFQF
jgi:predicted regulator of Ras-like GTPase activity (Roadblock/LC7/MglB family)